LAVLVRQIDCQRSIVSSHVANLEIVARSVAGFVVELLTDSFGKPIESLVGEQ
jgi:hypothetical protein